MPDTSEQPLEQKSIKEISLSDLEKAIEATIAKLTNGREPSVNIGKLKIEQGYAYRHREFVTMEMTIDLPEHPTYADDEAPFQGVF
tara:strand:- start:334 stop:591 length:258 start_codon:yes stop_codon:yes gene_type:complete